MLDNQLLMFTGIVFVLAITPGADTMLVMRNVLASDWRAGVMTNLGVCAGLLTHAIFSALGLSLILMRSAVAFELVKIVGGGYLIFLGLQALWQAFNHRSIVPRSTTPTAPDPTVISSKEKPFVQNAFAQNAFTQKNQAKTARRFFFHGLLTNLLNPKVALFYLAFLPQFIQTTDAPLFQAMLLGGIHLFFSFTWLIFVASFVGRLKHVLASAKVKRFLEATTGIILMGLGAKLVLERQPT